MENLPDYALASWLEQSFNKYGIGRDVFIPRKQDIKGEVSAFVRMEKESQASQAILALDGSIYGDKRCWPKGQDFQKKDMLISGQQG